MAKGRNVFVTWRRDQTHSALRDLGTATMREVCQKVYGSVWRGELQSDLYALEREGRARRLWIDGQRNVLWVVVSRRPGELADLEALYIYPAFKKEGRK